MLTIIADSVYRNQKQAKALAPKGLTFEVRSHSTALHLNVFLNADEQAPLLVWYKTN